MENIPHGPRKGVKMEQADMRIWDFSEHKGGKSIYQPLPKDSSNMCKDNTSTQWQQDLSSFSISGHTLPGFDHLPFPLMSESFLICSLAGLFN